MIGLWPDRAVPVVPGAGAIGRNRVFPSGRQALAAALAKAGLSRPDRLALPEWSSACVIGAAGQIASPLPLAEALEMGRPVAAALIYEQWGWPVDADSIGRAAARLRSRAIVLDRVDSLPEPAGAGGIEIFSLSKTLGLSGGGLVRWDGAWLEAERCDEPAMALEAIAAHPHGAAIMKTYVRALPADVSHFAGSVDPFATFAAERARRIRNLAVVRRHRASAGWTAAMEKALAAGAAPGIAPLALGTSLERIAAAAELVGKTLGVQCAAYHFDAARDAVEPIYVRCLAAPLHGLIDEDRLAALLDLAPRP